MDCNWYILCTKPKRERKVAQTLKELHIQHYCPINKKVQRWKKRQETIYEPLFASYVFVKASVKDLNIVTVLPEVLHVVQRPSGPVIAPPAEIKAIKEFMKTHQNVRFASTMHTRQKASSTLQANLVDKEGTIIPTKTQLVKVSLPSLGVLLYAQEVKKNAARSKSQVGTINK